jgi:putative invertase/resolvase
MCADRNTQPPEAAWCHRGHGHHSRLRPRIHHQRRLKAPAPATGNQAHPCPGLDQTLAELGEGDTLVVWRLDRLGRSLPHLVATIDNLTKRGVNLRSLHEAIDTTTPTGRLMVHLIASLAAFERELTIERTIAGLEAAKARGASLGRPTVWTPQRAEAAEALLTAGATVTEVAQALNVSRATVYRHANPPKTVPTRTCPHH